MIIMLTPLTVGNTHITRNSIYWVTLTLPRYLSIYSRVDTPMCSIHQPRNSLSYELFL